ncbi:hypothetical protein [Streptomyces sp. NPDC002082]|uniref:hypothetical protein n=1 Tax=Streptomyces sp. NPDC002082 TaxID=3154772 RepID=UPI0033311203
MTRHPRTRLDHVHNSVGIAQLALQQIQDQLGSESDAQDLAEILRELHDQDHRQDGLFGSLAQLLTVAAQPAGGIYPDREYEIARPLHDAAKLITERAGLELASATRALDPQGEFA